MPTPSPAARLLHARLLAGDRRAAQDVAKALRLAGGSPSAAAQRLGIGRATLHRWLDLPVFRGVPLVRRGRGQHSKKNRPRDVDLAR